MLVGDFFGEVVVCVEEFEEVVYGVEVFVGKFNLVGLLWKWWVSFYLLLEVRRKIYVVIIGKFGDVIGKVWVLG